MKTRLWVASAGSFGFPGEQPEWTSSHIAFVFRSSGSWLWANSHLKKHNSWCRSQWGLKIMAFGRLVLHPLCFTQWKSHRFSEPSWHVKDEKRDGASLFCCWASVARTEPACSRCSVNIYWMSDCFSTTCQVLLGAFHPMSHLIFPKQWDLALR